MADKELLPTIGYAHDVGGRPNLEDRMLGRHVRTANGETLTVALVADGIGGNNFGEVAAELTVDTVMAVLQTAVLQQPSQLPQLLAHALTKANQMVVQEAADDETKLGMGTTATLVVIHQQRLYLAHAGDSRAYLVHDGEAIQLTRDHTWGNLMVERGHLSAAEAAVHPKGEHLTRSIGYEPTIDVDLALYTAPDQSRSDAVAQQGFLLRPDDRLVVCSDGLIKQRANGKGQYATAKDIARQVTRRPAAKAAQNLVDQALSRNVDDNVSVIVVKAAAEQASKRRSRPLVMALLVLLLLIGGLASFILLNNDAVFPIPATPAPFAEAEQPTSAPTAVQAAIATLAPQTELLIEKVGKQKGRWRTSVGSQQFRERGNIAWPDGERLLLTNDICGRGPQDDGCVSRLGVFVVTISLGDDTEIALEMLPDEGQDSLLIEIRRGIVFVNSENGAGIIRFVEQEPLSEKTAVLNGSGQIAVALTGPEPIFAATCLAGICQFGSQTEFGAGGMVTSSQPETVDTIDYEAYQYLSPNVVTSTPTVTPTATITSTPTQTATPWPTATHTITPTLSTLTVTLTVTPEVSAATQKAP
ncbi:MAG: protein phosphatase 2C domain-containing protein [Chloroflexota bacterium]